MALPVATLDHVVINARDDLDHAADTYRRLGFTLTPRGYHSLGSMNHLAMFGNDFLELIAVPKGATIRRDLLSYSLGLNGLAFGTEDSTTTYDALSNVGLAVEPPLEFIRPVEVDGGAARDARFRAVRMKGGGVPYGRVFFIHHFTRDLLWRDEWRHHANGVVAVVRAMIVDADPASGTKLYADMFGPEVVHDIKGGKNVVAGNANLEVITETTLKDQFGPSVPDAEGRGAYMAGLTFRTVSLAKVAKALQAGEIEFVQSPGRLVVPARLALNTLLEFVE
ncbi:VOC family protein [Bradyrhizobium ganzhouense]|uniref:VOC family protein n=1 Tax=Bradyrhizobium ganzhouense TaxID=1179767 RepID=UPI003CF1A833